MSDDPKGISRREMFTFWRRRGEPSKEAAGGTPSASASASAPAPSPPQPQAPPAPIVYDPLRPPGAIFETLFVDTCQRCGKCVEVCPRQAIYPLGEEWGESKGTPAIRPRQAPCVVCTDLACTKACPSGALLQLGLADLQMGTAIVEETRCVTWQGQACSLCAEACPVSGALTMQAGHPVVSSTLCIGCGVCENVCPTTTASIVVEPARELQR